MNEKEFIAKQIVKLKSNGIKIFPEDFCNLSATSLLILPETNLVIGKDFFGSFEISTTSGETILSVKNQSEAKFIVYSSKKRLKKIKIPKDLGLITEAVKKYEQYLDELLSKIKHEYLNENLEIRKVGTTSGEIFKKLNLTRL